MNVEIVPCLGDNYSYIVVCASTGAAAIVDPSEARPVIAAAKALGVTPIQLWCTHHHGDHVGGLPEVVDEFDIPDVVAHEEDGHGIEGVTRPVHEGAAWKLGAIEVRAIHTPGHTRGALTYFCSGRSGHAAFTGDTLFVAGCGRLFEGSAEQMFESMTKLAALPPQTALYCGHEYTLANLRFARHAEPDNEALDGLEARAEKARAMGKPTVPSTIAEELRTNPFLRARSAEEFGERRRAKDRF